MGDELSSAGDELHPRHQNRGSAAVTASPIRFPGSGIPGGAWFRDKLFKSITVDNGCEFQDFEGIEAAHRRKGKRTIVFFCHPYSAFERGSNENMNRLLRRFFPKGTSFDTVKPEEVRAAERWVNIYPRKLLWWKSAAILFEKELLTA